MFGLGEKKSTTPETPTPAPQPVVTVTIPEESFRVMPDHYLPGRAKTEIASPTRSNKGFFALVAILAIILGAMIIGLLLYVRSLNQTPTTNSDTNVNAPTTTVTVPVATSTPSNDLSSADSRDLQRVKDVATLQAALSAYFTDNKLYPQVLNAMGTKYLLTVPVDPATSLAYTYNATSDGSSYSLFFTIEKQAIFNNQILQPGLYQLTPAGLQQPGSTENPTQPVTPETPPATPTGDSQDVDNDGLTAAEEISFRTDAIRADTDGDGFSDGEEVGNLYSPIASQRSTLDVSGLVRLYTNSNWNYQLWYAEDWVVRSLDQDGKEVIFTSPVGDSVTLVVENNEALAGLDEWLDARNPGLRASLHAEQIAGQAALRSADGLTVYLAQGKNFFTLTYRPAANGQIDYPMVLKVMLKSWSFK